MSTEDSLAWLVVSHSPSAATVSSDLLRRKDIDDVSGSKHLAVNEQHEEAAGEQSSLLQFSPESTWQAVIDRF